VVLRGSPEAVTLPLVLSRLIFAGAFGWVLPAAGEVSLDPPPGWEYVSATASGGDVLAALKGPERSSFLLTRVPPTDLQDRAVVRALLFDILAELNKKTGLGLAADGNLKALSFDNGLSAHTLRVLSKGRPRMILAVMEHGGMSMVGILTSSLAESMLPQILGSLRVSPRALKSPPRALSLDGQLSLDLPQGFQSRPLAESERRMGFVLALKGPGSELMVMRLSEDEARPKEQARILRGTVLSVGGVEASTLSRMSRLKTQAGPELVYAWARMRSGEGQFAAGCLPWGTWGYSVIAKGPRAVEALEELRGLGPGPSAQPGLVAETPRVLVTEGLRLRGRLLLLALPLVLGAAFFLFGRRRRG